MQSELYPTLMDGALRFVSIRPRSTKEVRDWLTRTLKRRHTTAPGVAKQIITRLVELEYLDDQKFASWWVSQRRNSTPKGTRLIQQELVAKGISKEDAEHALRERTDEKETARKAVGAKLKRWAVLPPTEQKKKIWSYLLRRGFDSQTVRSVVDDIAGKEYNVDRETEETR